MNEGRHNPFRGFVDMFAEMERMRRLGRGGRHLDDDEDRGPAAAWVPAADIFAVGSDLVIRLELPGVEQDGISITFDGGRLTVAGERRDDLGPDVEFYVRERRSGAFHRSMVLPDEVDESRISAVAEAGLVEITVAGGARGGEPHRIAIENRPGRRVTRVARRPAP